MEMWKDQHPNASPPEPGTPEWTQILDNTYNATMRKSSRYTFLYESWPGWELVRHLDRHQYFRSEGVIPVKVLSAALKGASASSSKRTTTDQGQSYSTLNPANGTVSLLSSCGLTKRID